MSSSESKPWVWLGVFVVIVAAAVLVPQREDPKPTGPVGTPLAPGVRALMAGRLGEAEEAFKRVAPQLEPETLEARQLPVLRRIVDLWSIQPLDKDAAATALRELEGTGPLPPGMTAWIHLQRSKRSLAP